MPLGSRLSGVSSRMDRPGAPLRVGVVGVGYLGRHHARILSSLPDVQLVAVVDTNGGRAQDVAAATSSRAFYDASTVVGLVDAVTVAVPTADHLAVALPFLNAGVPVLVEKPMAGTLVEADAMIAAAHRSGAVLAVGHTERFNPAVEAARQVLADPRFIEGHRLGTFPERSLDIDVVLDLMIHDLDVVLSLVKADVESIEAVGVPVLTGRIDIANARLRFSNGCIANLTASRISRDRVRKLRFFQPGAYVSIDYAAQKLEVWRPIQQPGGVPTIEGGEMPVASDEPLKRELEDFVAAIRTSRGPLVSGTDGRRVLDLATRISDRIAAQRSPQPDRPVSR